MYWNEKEKKWKKHPLCTCAGPFGGNPSNDWHQCICQNLPTLDAEGKPCVKKEKNNESTRS